MCNGSPGRSSPPRTSAQIPPEERHRQPAPGRMRQPAPRTDRRSPPLVEARASGHRNSLARRAKGSQEAGGNNTLFLQIRDSAISNPRIWIDNELPTLGIKGSGNAAILRADPACNPAPSSSSLSLPTLSYPQFLSSILLVC